MYNFQQIKAHLKRRLDKLVEIKIAKMDVTATDFSNLLYSLADKISAIYGKKVEVKYSGRQIGPMSPMPYYYIVVPAEKKYGLFVTGIGDQWLLCVYPAIYGTARGTRDMFGSIFVEEIEDIVKNELKKFALKHGIDTIYLAEAFMRPF